MKTKIEIVEEMALLEKRCKALEATDLHLRDEFTKVLEDKYPPYTPDLYDYSNRRKVLEWESIFFKIGELNSDANYTILLEQKRQLSERLDKLIREKRKGKDEKSN